MCRNILHVLFGAPKYLHPQHMPPYPLLLRPWCEGGAQSSDIKEAIPLDDTRTLTYTYWRTQAFSSKHLFVAPRPFSFSISNFAANHSWGPIKLDKLIVWSHASKRVLVGRFVRQDFRSRDTASILIRTKWLVIKQKS